LRKRVAEHEKCCASNSDGEAFTHLRRGDVLMKTIVIRVARRLAPSLALVLPALAACSRGANSTPADTSTALPAKADSSASAVTLRGTVVSASANELVLKSDSGVVTVKLGLPFHLYARVPSNLSHVKESAFIGVTTVKQPDGSERATEIHVFPEELRGLGEGSRMMAPRAGSAGGAGNRMTNGNVSASRMTNGTASAARMSNGSVSSSNGSTLVVQYAGGSTTVTVPPTTPVTELKLTSKQLVAGDQIAVLAKRAADGSLTADRALSTTK
jgi:hypothetical protein